MPTKKNTKQSSFLQSTLKVAPHKRNHHEEQGAENFQDLPKTFKNKAGTAVNWPKVLRRVGEIGKKKVKTEKETAFLSLATRLSGHWVTCACGNQCSIIPRDASGEPYNDKLNVLGLEFFEHVERAEWRINEKSSPYHALRSAAATLNKIEKESTKLVKDILSKKK